MGLYFYGIENCFPPNKCTIVFIGYPKEKDVQENQANVPIEKQVTAVLWVPENAPKPERELFDTLVDPIKILIGGIQVRVENDFSVLEKEFQDLAKIFPPPPTPITFSYMKCSVF